MKVKGKNVIGKLDGQSPSIRTGAKVKGKRGEG